MLGANSCWRWGHFADHVNPHRFQITSSQQAVVEMQTHDAQGAAVPMARAVLQLLFSEGGNQGKQAWKTFGAARTAVCRRPRKCSANFDSNSRRTTSLQLLGYNPDLQRTKSLHHNVSITLRFVLWLLGLDEPYCKRKERYRETRNRESEPACPDQTSLVVFPANRWTRPPQRIPAPNQSYGA